MSKVFVWNTQEDWEGETDGRLYDSEGAALLAGSKVHERSLYVGERCVVDTEQAFIKALGKRYIISDMKSQLWYDADVLLPHRLDAYEDDDEAKDVKDLAKALLPSLRKWLKSRGMHKPVYSINNIHEFDDQLERIK